MFHGTLTVISKLRPEAVESARATLRGLDQSIRNRGHHPLREIQELYFAHWGLSGAAPWSDPSPHATEDCYLLFGADLRLTKSLHGRAQLRAAVALLVDRLAAHAARTGDTTFDTLYGHCEGYRETGGLARPERVRDWMLAHALPYDTRHIDFAYRVATLPQVRELSTVRDEVEHYLNDRYRRPWLERQSTGSVHRALREQLGARLERLSDPEWERHLAAALFEAALATLLYLPFDSPLRLLLRLKNRLFPPGKTVERVTVPDALREEIEARQGSVQNSMILVSDVPESWLGQVRQRFFMALVNWRIKRNRVGINDLRSIHFARWTLFQRGTKKQLVFMVTYDESWESYIDAFVDDEEVSNFLKLIWSGSTGFPSGLPFVEPFKEWIRSVQCPTQVHYSALLHGEPHPRPLAVTDLHESLELRRMLVTESLQGPEFAAQHSSLERFLGEGRFPFQAKLLSPRQWSQALWERLSAPWRSTHTSSRRSPHVTDGEMGVLREGAAARQPSLEPFPPSAPGEAARRPGPARVRLQGHERRFLPGSPGPGRRSLPGLAARDPRGGTHDSGEESS